MRAASRRRQILLLSAVLLFGSSEVAGATGLYKGHGRRTHDYLWAWRLNGSVGFHGVEDPWDQFGVSSYPVGGYTDFGIEIATLPWQSLEILGSYRWVDDDEQIVAVGAPGYIPQPGFYSYQVDTWGAGGTWRFYYPGAGGSGYFGLGGGWVFGSELEYVEQVAGGIPYAVRAEGNGPELHAQVGFDAIVAAALRMGLELGFRYSWVDFDNGIYGAGDFNGFFLGFRLGLVVR